MYLQILSLSTSQHVYVFFKQPRCCLVPSAGPTWFPPLGCHAVFSVNDKGVLEMQVYLGLKFNIRCWSRNLNCHFYWECYLNCNANNTFCIRKALSSPCSLSYWLSSPLVLSSFNTFLSKQLFICCFLLSFLDLHGLLIMLGCTL